MILLTLAEGYESQNRQNPHYSHPYSLHLQNHPQFCFYLKDSLLRPPYSSDQVEEHCSKFVLGTKNRRNVLLCCQDRKATARCTYSFTGVNQAESAFWFSLPGLSASVLKYTILLASLMAGITSRGTELHHKVAQKSYGHNLLLQSLGRCSSSYMYPGKEKVESTSCEHDAVLYDCSNE